MKHFKQLLLVLLALVTFSCGKSEPENTEPTPTPKPTDKIELAAGTDLNPVISTDGGTLSVTFNASTAWSAQAVNDRADGWCSVSPTSGNAGSSTITITAKANTEPDERSASINIKAGTAAQTIKVTQKQKDALTVTSSTFEVPAEGKDINIEVKANVNVTYKIDEQCSSWIKYVSTKALKNSTLTFAVSKNESFDKREGKIIIGEGALCDTIKIFQAGEAPSIVLNKDEYIAKSEGETFAIEVASNVDVSYHIEYTYEDGTINTDSENWLQESKTRAMSTNTYYFTAGTNENYDNRQARIVFTNKENNLSDTIKVTQLQKDAIIIAKNVYEIDNKGGNISVELAHNVDYKITIGADWITQVETKGLETDYLTFEIAENKEYDNRDAIITFSSADGSITQDVKVCQSQANAVIISKKEYILNSTGGDVTIEVRSNVDFNVENPNCDWIDEVKTKGLTTHTLNYKVAENTGYDSRTASIIITNSKTGEKDSVVISQLQKDAIVLAKSEYEFGIGGGNLDFEIETNVDVTVEISDNARSWITEVETRGLVKKTLLFNIASCYKMDKREGWIRLTGGDAKQTITVRQNGMKEILDKERDALIEFYNSTGGNNWYYSTNWCSDKPVNNWYGVTTNSRGQVVTLDLTSNNLSGTLTESLIDLTELQFALLYYNGLYGEIPQKINEAQWFKDYWQWVVYKNNFDESILPIKAPTFSDVKTLSGETISSSIYQQNKLTILYNWNPGHSMSENYIAKLQQIYTKYKSKGLDIISYSSHNDINAIESYLKENDIDWKTFSTLANKTFTFTNIVTPGINIIDPDGNIVYTSTIQGYNNIEEFVEEQLGPVEKYESTDFSEDGKVVQLQKATIGNGIDIVLMGDGFSDRQIADGTYRKYMNSAMEGFFAVEPYTSFRNHFNVYAVTAVSKNETIGNGQETVFSSYWNENNEARGNNSKVLTYARKVVDDANMDNTTIIVLINTLESIRSVCYMYHPDSDNQADWGCGTALTYTKTSYNNTQMNQTLNHEANGHGFGKLYDEYNEFAGTIPESEINSRNQMRPFGWGKNIDFTNDPALVKWARFLSDQRYQYDGLGLFEGGLRYTKGVWRPTISSIMKSNTGGFNAPSREAIYYRIHKLAYGPDWEYDYEKFVEYDAINRKTSAESQTQQVLPLEPVDHTPPVIVGKSWRESMKD